MNFQNCVTYSRKCRCLSQERINLKIERLGNKNALLKRKTEQLSKRIQRSLRKSSLSLLTANSKVDLQLRNQGISPYTIKGIWKMESNSQRSFDKPFKINKIKRRNWGTLWVSRFWKCADFWITLQVSSKLTYVFCQKQHKKRY